MTNSNNQISTEEALAALETLDSAKTKSNKSFRPALWLNFIISLFTGIVCFAAPFSSGNSLWTFIMLVSAAGLLISMATWYILLRVRGVKQNIIPYGLKNKFFNLALGILVALVILGSIELYKAGFLWIPYVAGPLNAIFISYMLYSFPTGEWK
jgi:uncharacterized membrane protein